MSAESRIYLSPPHMSELAREYLLNAFDSNWIAPIGPDLSAFEEEFADYVGVKHAVAVSSGTAALHLAMRLLGIESGDTIPVSSLTFIAPANAICYTGAKPVFVDSEYSSWNMDPALLRQAIEELSARGKKPKAVVVVDILGQCAEYQAIVDICRSHDIAIIEDAAEALGASYRGQKAGTFGDIGCFSFNGNKIITTSSGGMLVTNREDWAAKARHLSTQAKDPAPHYEHSEVGYNYRMSNLLAAIGRGQLRVVDDYVRRRREICSWYQDRFASIRGIEFMPELEHGESNRWLTCILVDPSECRASREEIRLALVSRQIESRPCWKPMHLQQLFSESERYGGEVSEDIFERGLCLPSGSDLSQSDLERIARVIEQIA